MEYQNTDHTFAVCAYKESPYLESCIKSLVNQKVKVILSFVRRHLVSLSRIWQKNMTFPIM